MEKDEKLADALSQLDRDVERSLATANRALADGVRSLKGSPLRGSHGFSVATYNLRWGWQDQLAKVMRRYVRQLWRVAKRHQVSSVSAWIASQLRTVREVIERSLLVEFGKEPMKLAARAPKPLQLEPIPQGENRERVMLFARGRPRLRGELTIFHGDTKLRIPIFVSAQTRFLESLVLRGVKGGVKPDHRGGVKVDQ
jgi:hypothetical protein